MTQTKDESEASDAKRLSTVLHYDAYGNVDYTILDDVSGPATARTTDFTFDANGQFPTTVTINGVGLATQITFNPLFGTRSSVTGPDGLTTSFLYDDFGRVTKETRPVGYTTFAYDDCWACWPESAYFFVRALGSDGSEAYQYFDNLQRPVASSWTLPQGRYGRRQTFYDSLGQVWQVSQPYDPLDPTIYWVQHEYDLLGRLTKEEIPQSEAQLLDKRTTTYEHLGLERWVTDDKGHTTKYVANAAGQIREVIDALIHTTSYTYKPFGELASVTDVENNTTSIEYDARGFKSSMTDPNMGYWVYDTNVYGELASQTNGASQTVTLAYDAAGRLDTRSEPEGITKFKYHASGLLGKGGKPDEICPWSGTACLTTGQKEKYTYDAVTGQPSQIQRTLDGTVYNFDFTFDSQGRLDVMSYPDIAGYRFKVDYDFDASGELSVAKDGNTGSIFYILSETDALGREEFVTLGNGLVEQRTFDRASGQLAAIDTGPSGTSTIQDLMFTWDEVGNLATRQNALIGKTETFVYDALDRLDTAQVSGGGALNDVNYSDAGRITFKTGVGNYTYTGGSCGGGPDAVKNANGQNYCYDANGRMTAHGADTFEWFSYDLPKKLAVGTKTAEFSYGVGRDRYKQVQKTGSTTDATIYYAGTLFQKEIAGATTTYRHYVSARGRAIAQVSRVGTTNTVQYLHRDHQDSMVEVTSSSGALVQSLAFDAWGLRRNAASWAALGSPFGGSEPTERGYTGHEHLDKVELIHMNGRVQDPKLGLFISADPFVQAPYHSQSLNRYSYVWNNPPTLVDPSGFQTNPCQEGMSAIDCDTLIAMGRGSENRGSPGPIFGGDILARIDGLIRSNIENPPIVVPPIDDGAEDPLGTWSLDFPDGVARRVANDGIDQFTGIVLGPIVGGAHIIFGDPVEVFEPPKTARGEFGYDVGPAAEVLAGVRGLKGAVDDAAEAALKGRRTFPTADRAAGLERARDAEGVPRCQYCGTELDVKSGRPNSYEPDHATPYARGGPSTPENLTPSCRTCNRKKGARTPEEWDGP